jgi:hypothetical protein
LQKEKIAGDKILGRVIHQQEITSRPRNDIVQDLIPFGRHILYPLAAISTASVANKNTRPFRIDDRIICYQALAGCLVMTALPPGHSKIQTDSRCMTIHNQIVFNNMTSTAKPNPSLSCIDTISLNQAIRATSHDKLTIAMREYVSAIGIARALIADDLSFSIASIKYVVLDNRARYNVSIRRLIRPDFDCLPSIPALPGNILEMVVANDIFDRNAVFVYLVIHLKVYATCGNIGKSTITNVILSGSLSNTYRRSFPTTVLEHAIDDPAMIGSLDIQEILLKIALLESKIVYSYVATGNRNVATTCKDNASGTLRANRHGMPGHSPTIQIGRPSIVSSVGDYDGIARLGFPNGL